MTETEKLLAVLDMTGGDQNQWCYEHIRELHGNCFLSLADLAFRLRDEAVVEYEDYWGQAAWIVYEYFTGAKDKLLTSSWFLCVAKPIHFIIAALIAKELAKDK